MVQSTTAQTLSPPVLMGCHLTIELNHDPACDAQAAEQEAEVRNLHCQLATLADDSETSLLRASQADTQAAKVRQEADQLRQAASEAINKEQVSTAYRVAALSCSVKPGLF